MLRWLIFNALLIISVGYALRYGERTERFVAIIFIAGIILTFFVTAPFHERFASLQTPLLLVDAGVFVALVLVALWSTKFWPLWVAAMQGVSAISHLSILFGPEVGSTVYGHAVQLWSYPMLILLLIGTRRTVLRRGET